MRVETTAGVYDLGETETTPTIGMTDYSRRETDDFGVTTVVERGFSRRMSVRMALAFDQADAVQRRLADLRATAALWVAHDNIDWLKVRGYYKDFTLDHAVPPVSFCTLAVEGLAEPTPGADAGGDPALPGRVSTFHLIQPADVTNAALASSSVPETDYPQWSAGTTYPAGARVILTAAHRVYESLLAGNAGAAPAISPDKWLDIGPTNRWAMFDQALGTATTTTGNLVVKLNTSGADAVALLDVTGATVRVQGSGYDRSAPAGPGAVTFLGIPANAGQLTVTVSGSGQVSVGTLLIGRHMPLGVTEASPSSSITDFSRKQPDEFGEVTVVERAWSKRMTARALIRTDAVDMVANRIATVRARPSLWIGKAGRDSLTVYGFWKDFSIEVGETVSKLSLTIEGLSTAAKPLPLKAGEVDWPNVKDPLGTKPADNATNSGDLDSPFGPDDTIGDAIDAITEAQQRVETLEREVIPVVDAAVARANEAITAARADADAALTQANARIDDARADADAALAEANTRIEGARTKADEAKAAADATLAEIESEVTLVHSRIDHVSATGGENSQLWAEVQRIDSVSLGRDATLARSVQTVSASVDTVDSNLRAEVSRVETAAANRDAVIGQRIDSIVVSIGEADGADSFARAEITRVEQAAVTRDTALGTRIDTIAAQVGDADGADNFARAEITRIEQAYADADTALARRMDTMKAGYETADSATNTRITTEVDALAEADAAIGRRIDSIVAESEGGGADVFARSEISRVETASANRDTALGSRIDTFTTDYKAADTATNTRITNEVTALSDADQAFAERVEEIDTKFTGLNTSTNTRITTEVTALSDADAAIGRRIDSIVADGNGGDTDTFARSEISRVETAAVNRDNALGSRIDTVQASMLSGGGNLLANTDFVTADGWTPFSTMATAINEFGVNIAGDAQHPVGENVLGLRQSGRVGNGNLYSGWRSARVPVRGGTYVQFYVFAASLRSNKSATLYFYDANGTVISFSATTLEPEGLGGGRDPAKWTQQGSPSVLVPTNAISCAVELRKFDTDAGQADSYAWWWRPYIGGAREGQNSWSSWAPGTGRAVSAKVREQVTALADADSAFAERASDIEAAAGALAGRVTSTETALADLPNQFVTAQRATNIEASIGGLSGRVTNTETAVTDGRFAAAAAVTTLRSAYEGTAATVTQQAGTLTGLGQRTAAYIKLIADAGNGRGAFSLWSDEFGGAWQLDGDGLINGNLTINGTLNARSFNRASMSREGRSVWNGNITPGTGQTVTVPWSLSLTQIPPMGRFIYELFVNFNSNAGTSQTTTFNGRPAYTYYVDDGGLRISATDAQGNAYLPKANGSSTVLATTDFVPLWTASVSRGNASGEFVSQGDYYERTVSAQYTLIGIDLKVTWVAI